MQGVEMVAPPEALEDLLKYPEDFPLPLEPMHGWRSSRDEGGHGHCRFCSHTVYRGDPVVGCYLKYVSVIFCPTCVADNPELFKKWLASGTESTH